MTNEQKRKIIELRHKGVSHQVIGNILGISRNTVKTFCRRNSITCGNSDEGCQKDIEGICPECGKTAVQSPGRKPKRFCSPECRQKWWNAHPERVGQKAVYKYICPGCGQSFTAYGNSHRKYCFHECYVAARFKGGEACD